MPETYNFPSHYKGDTFEGLRFTIIFNGAPLNLTDAVIRMDMRKDKKATASLTKRLSSETGEIVIVDAEAGIFEIQKQIIDLVATTYHYDIEFQLANGEVKTFIEGTWEILQDVTHG